MDPINTFLAKDSIGLADPTFSTTRHIAQLIIQKKNIQGLYQQYSELENDCESLIGQVIDARYKQFNPLVFKPATYGKCYDRISQSVKQNRKRLAKAKELLSARTVDLKQTYYHQLYCKEIMLVLNKLRAIRHSIYLMENTYEGCLEFRKTRMLLNSLPHQKSAQVQHLSKLLGEKAVSIMTEFHSQLLQFFFGFKDQVFSHDDAKTFHDATANPKKELLPNVTIKNDEELSMCLVDSCPPFSPTYEQLRKFIKISFTFPDYDQVKTLIEANTDRNGDIALSHKLNANLLSLFFCIKGAILLRDTNRLLNRHFEDFKQNMQDMFSRILILFVKKQHKNHHTQYGLFGELNFTNTEQFSNVSEFFKKLIAYVVILMRKQILFGKILHFANVDVDDNTLLLTLSELCRQLFWQVNVVLSLFYKKLDLKPRELLDVRNEFHIFINSALSHYISPSPLYYLLQRQLLDDSLNACIESIQSFMRIEPLFKEPIENELVLQHELNKSIFEDCVRQVFEGVKSCIRKTVTQGKQFTPCVQYAPQVQCTDQALNEMINLNQLASFDALRMQIPECVQITSIVLQLSLINGITKLKENFPDMLNWILNVFHQEVKGKLKACITGALSEQLLLNYNQEKVTLLKKLISYMKWKVRFQQSNELLNDGINTAARLEKALKDKQMKAQLKGSIYQGYKEFLTQSFKGEAQLIRSKETIHSIGALHENIAVVLELCKQAIFRYAKELDKNWLMKELDLQPKESEGDRIAILKSFQLRCEQTSLKIEKQNIRQNALESSFNDNYPQKVYRMLDLYNQVFQVQLNCYLILRLEFHLRCLLMQNIQDFYFDYCSFSNALKESVSEESAGLILQDFWSVFKASVKAQFVREKDFNAKKIQMILKDLTVLREDFKVKKVSHIRRYFKLFLVQPGDLEKFLKLNAFKYKYSVIEEYCGLCGGEAERVRRYCL